MTKAGGSGKQESVKDQLVCLAKIPLIAAGDFTSWSCTRGPQRGEIEILDFIASCAQKLNSLASQSESSSFLRETSSVAACITSAKSSTVTASSGVPLRAVSVR